MAFNPSDEEVREIRKLMKSGMRLALNFAQAKMEGKHPVPSQWIRQPQEFRCNGCKTATTAMADEWPGACSTCASKLTRLP